MANDHITFLELELVYHTVQSMGARMPDKIRLSSNDMVAMLQEADSYLKFKSGDPVEGFKFRGIPIVDDMLQRDGTLSLIWGDQQMNWMASGVDRVLKDVIKAAIAGLNDTFQATPAGFALGGQVPRSHRGLEGVPLGPYSER